MAATVYLADEQPNTPHRSRSLSEQGLTLTDRLLGEASRWRAGAGAELVQVIGSTIVLYKESQDHKQIVLP